MRTSTKTSKKVSTQRKAAPAPVRRKGAMPKKGARPMPKSAPTRKRQVREAEVIRPIDDKLTKVELFDTIAEECEMERKQVRKVYESLVRTVYGALHKRGYGEIILPGLARFMAKDVEARKVPAVKAGQTKVNPFTGEEYVTEFRAAYTKPANVKVQIRAVKAMKDAAGVTKFTRPGAKPAGRRPAAKKKPVRR